MHRWRRLESSNPELYDLITRVHKLQRRLLGTTDDIAERESLIRQKESLYSELKAVLSRQPDAEASEKVLILQQTLKTKQAQLRAMEQELLTCKDTVADQKKELDILAADTASLETRFVRRMKFEMTTTE